MAARFLQTSLVGFAGRTLAALSLAGAASAQLIVGVLSNGNQPTVWHIDVASGERTPLFQASSSALAVDDANGVVYSADGSKLSSWNYGAGPVPSYLGVVKRPNGTPLNLVGLAFGGGRLFGTVQAFAGQDWLFEIDLTTLTATPIPEPVTLVWVEGLSFDATSGLFYAVNDYASGTDDHLYSIDILNGGAPLYLGLIQDDADSAAIGPNGKLYIVPDSGAPIDTFDLAAGTYAHFGWSPFGYGLDESGSEWAPSLVISPNAPQVYCTPGQSSGCLMRSNYTGAPSASAGSGFVVMHSSLAANSRTQLHYSFAGPTQVAFGGAYRCIRPPVFRLPPVYTATSGPACYDQSHSLSVSVDFNAYIASGVNPALVAGQPVWMQLAAQTPNLTSIAKFDLSPGLSFTIGP